MNPAIVICELEYCIKQLKKEARESIFLAYYHGYTHKELS
jgi:DNA-directed RNA polymerase specialized sigma24 family protein